MLTLDKVKACEVQFIKNILTYVNSKPDLKKTVMDQLKEGIILSFIGAKICYLSGKFSEFYDALQENLSVERVVNFLTGLHRKGHYSVFAHSPLVLPIEKKDYSSIKTDNLTKVYWDGSYVYLNLRHFAEGLDNTEFTNFLKEFVKEVSIVPVKSKGILEIYKYKEKTNCPQIFVFQLSFYSKANSWYSVVLENCSRVCSHQLVRHTWLNFNQKSQRYVRVRKDDYYFLSKNLRKESVYSAVMVKLLPYLEGLEELMDRFKDGPLSKEDLRYLYPQNIGTTLMFSGWDWQLEDLIQKRAVKEAQEEIRDYVLLLNDLL